MWVLQTLGDVNDSTNQSFWMLCVSNLVSGVLTVAGTITTRGCYTGGGIIGDLIELEAEDTGGPNTSSTELADPCSGGISEAFLTKKLQT